MSHFKAVQSREDFKLASGFKVPGTVAQYLRGFQLEGVKFIADHLLNQESCILNDQSGLGKTAVVVAFFSAFVNQRTIIIVNDESNVLHWQYHFEKLAKICVGAIDEEGASTKEAIQIIRWSTLVNNPKILPRLNYKILVLDNRGKCLSNKICESFLVKNFEGKVQLLVDSEDLTSDLDLLYTSFRLIGRLEKKYERKSVFIDRFSLPGAKDKLVKEKDFLERYYMLRNVIRDYCGSYRLRRYAHQYDQYMPLTNKSDFEKNFQHWLGIGNNNSETIVGNVSSQDSVKIVSSNSSTSTNELFETLYLSPKSQDVSQNAQNFLDNEEDNMPPLMFEDESDTDQPKSEKSPPSTSPSTNKKSCPPPKKVIDSEEKKRLKLAKMLEIDFTSKYQVNKSILKNVEKADASSPKDKPPVIKKEPKRLSPVKMLLPIREPKLKAKPVNKQLEKLKKLLDIDCTPKHQFNKNVLNDVVKQEKDEDARPKKKERVVEKKKKRVEEKKKERVEEKQKQRKERVEEKKKQSTEVKTKKLDTKKKEKTDDKKNPKHKIKENGDSKPLKSKGKLSPEELKRKRLERLLQIDFTPKYQLNNISRKLYKVTKTRDLKETPKEKKRAKDDTFQNAQKFIESASPDTTTQDFIPPARMRSSNTEEFSLDIDKEMAKLRDAENDVEVEEQPPADVIVLSDDSEHDDDDDDDDFVSPDIFGGRLDELITDDESINCSQTLPAQKTQTTSAIKPAKPKKSTSCLQQLESQDLSSDGHNFMDVYSEFLQAQKSNETSPVKSTTNNSKPVSIGNKITKYFGGANALQAREILKTPTRRKSFSGIRRSPKTPPTIQNNNIMTWLVRPSSSSSADHQDSSITSSSKDIKRRRLDY